jgi:hypothetical protein
MRNLYSTSRTLPSLNLPTEVIELIDNLEYHTAQERTWATGRIRHYVENDLPLQFFIQNYEEIKLLGKDSSSEKSHILRFGPIIGKQRFDTKCEQSIVYTKEILVALHGEEEAKRLMSERGASLENYQKRHGIEKGQELWDSYKAKRNTTYKQKRAAGHVFPKYNLDYYIELYGVMQGTVVFNTRIEKQRYKVSLQYYIDTYGEEEGRRLCRLAKDHGSLDYFVNKFGPVEGLVKYKENCVKMAEAREGLRPSFSKASKRLFDALKEYIPELEAYGPNEIFMQVPDESALDQKILLPDLYYNGKIIEFNGDLFHGNPRLFEATDYPNPFDDYETAADMWRNDMLRYEIYLNKGYSVLEVWELDYKRDEEGVIQTCLQFLMN